MAGKNKDRDLQNFALVSLSECEDAISKAPVISENDKLARAHVLALLGIGYALTDLSDQLAEGEE